ncbi:hypothetical protein [Alteromonas sp. ASW11-130]|uniref:hypothetical protein n=1 Tax=Alteromonas sp. ASW11-130 TaxID=3015775 RepID=UPI002242389C|nr:hypothetical protein [Alteromonas sp. ASW11-130]MCW8090746.1 hypothetical protein [Alteromonas sp. ASW11-130]
MVILRVPVILIMVMVTLSCGGGDSTNETTPAKSHQLNSVPDHVIRAPSAVIELLLIGNSHSAVNDFPIIIEKLIATGTNKSVNVFNTSESAYLADRSRSSGNTYELVHSRDWTHVVLQAQRYSTSGSRTYPTTAAQEWVALLKKRNAIPIMYPEHPRLNNTEEGYRIFELHSTIARSAEACVAPIGPVWDLALQWYPEMALYQDDGNHFSHLGAFLSALVFYQIVTEQPVDELPVIDGLSVDKSTQLQLKQVVADSLAIYPPCEYL